jgi:hypothetical protein
VARRQRPDERGAQERERRQRDDQRRSRSAVGQRGQAHCRGEKQRPPQRQRQRRPHEIQRRRSPTRHAGPPGHGREVTGEIAGGDYGERARDDEGRGRGRNRPPEQSGLAPGRGFRQQYSGQERRPVQQNVVFSRRPQAEAYSRRQEVSSPRLAQAAHGKGQSCRAQSYRCHVRQRDRARLHRGGRGRYKRRGGQAGGRPEGPPRSLPRRHDPEQAERDREKPAEKVKRARRPPIEVGEGGRVGNGSENTEKGEVSGVRQEVEVDNQRTRPREQAGV